MRASLITILILFFAVNISIAQPLVVSKGLKEKFPTAENIKWIKEKYNYWKAEFILGGRKTSALFDVKGHWISAQQEIDLEEIGIEEVKAAIKKDFSTCKIISIEIVNWSGLGTWYHVEGSCGKEIIKRSYDHRGWPPPKIS